MSVSSGCRLVALDTNATTLPSADREGRTLALSALIPAVDVEARITSPLSRSLTNTSVLLEVSAATRFVELEWNATRVPSAEMLGTRPPRLPLTPAASADANSSSPESRSLT